MYTIILTDTADEGLRRIILFVAEKFGRETALNKLDEMEQHIHALADNPFLGIEPRYNVLRRAGYRVLVLEKDLAFYKVDERSLTVTVYAIVDQRQDYMKIIQGLT